MAQSAARLRFLQRPTQRFGVFAVACVGAPALQDLATVCRETERLARDSPAEVVIDRADQLGNSLYPIADGRETALTAERQLVNNSLRFSLDNRTITFEGWRRWRGHVGE